MTGGTTQGREPEVLPSTPALVGWAMRPDQAHVLRRAIGGELVMGADPSGVYVLLVEAYDGDGGGAGQWQAVPATVIPQNQIGARGHRLLDALGVPKAGREASWADLRPIGLDGDRAEGRTPCFCGSGVKAKRCQHAMHAPVVYAHSAVFLNQREWARRPPFDAAIYGDAGVVPKGSIRVAAAITTLTGRPFVQAVSDVAGDEPAVAVAARLVAELEVRLHELLPVLGGAEVRGAHGVMDEVDAPMR